MSVFFLKHPKDQDLALFSGGELGPLGRWRIERHLESCPHCKQAVAEFFHLQDELSPLAELPDIDWNSLAESIEERVAREAPAGVAAEPRRTPAWAWQAGLATASLICIVVVMRQAPWSTPRLTSESVVETAAVAQKAERAAPAPSQNLMAELEPAPQAASRANAPAEEKAMAEAPGTFADELRDAPAVEDLRKRAAPADDLAPPPPPPPAMRAGNFGAIRAKQEADSAEAFRAEAREDKVIGLRQQALQSVAETTASPAAPQPLARRQQAVEDRDVMLAADGRITVRAVSQEGILTITELYER